jgi:hypothetical protein
MALFLKTLSLHTRKQPENKGSMSMPLLPQHKVLYGVCSSGIPENDVQEKVKHVKFL